MGSAGTQRRRHGWPWGTRIGILLMLVALLTPTAGASRCRTETLDVARGEALFGAADQVFEGRLLRLEMDRVSQSIRRTGTRPRTCQDTDDAPQLAPIEVISGPSDTPDATAVFEVLRHWKGAAPEQIAVRVGSGLPWQAGEDYLVYAHATDARGRAVARPQIRLGCWPSVYPLNGTGRRDPRALVQHLRELPEPGSGGTLELYLTDLHGYHPLPDHDVHVQGPQGSVRARSDARGRVELRNLPAGDYVWRTAPPPQRRWSCAPCAPMVLPDRGRVVQSWTAQGEAELTVAVVDASGQPVRAPVRLVLLDAADGRELPWALHPGAPNPDIRQGVAVTGQAVLALLLQDSGDWPLDAADPSLKRVYTQGLSWTDAPRLDLLPGSRLQTRFALPASLTPVRTTVQLQGYVNTSRPTVSLQVGPEHGVYPHQLDTSGTRFTVDSLPGQAVTLRVHAHELGDAQGQWRPRLVLTPGQVITVPLRAAP